MGWRKAALELGAKPVAVGGGCGHGERPPVMTSGRWQRGGPGLARRWASPGTAIDRRPPSGNNEQPAAPACHLWPDNASSSATRSSGRVPCSASTASTPETNRQNAQPGRLRLAPNQMAWTNASAARARPGRAWRCRQLAGGRREPDRGRRQGEPPTVSSWLLLRGRPAEPSAGQSCSQAFAGASWRSAPAGARTSPTTRPA